jgi:hypothetical protein
MDDAQLPAKMIEAAQAAGVPLWFVEGLDARVIDGLSVETNVERIAEALKGIYRPSWFETFDRYQVHR